MFVKIRFRTTGVGATAGLVIRADVANSSTIADLSRLYPPSECLKMRIFEKSLPYATFDEAFAHNFDAPAIPHGVRAKRYHAPEDERDIAFARSERDADDGVQS